MPDTAALKLNKRRIVDEYAKADNRIASAQVACTLIPLAGLWWMASLGPTSSYVWPALATVAMSFLLLRVFVLMHECGHGSLFSDQRLNKAFGFLFGVISGMPQYVWTQHHNFHHATNGNWAKYRGPLATLTTEEYDALSAEQQKAYARDRRIRMAPLAGLLYMIVNPRINWIRGSWALLQFVAKAKLGGSTDSLSTIAARFEPRYWASSAEYRHMSLNNLVLLTLWVLMSLWLGPALFFTVYLLSGSLAGGAGIVLFTVQHNFEHAYASGTEGWDYDHAALHGTSYLHLPGWLNWFTANIGYHHVHHLSARIPNYRLARCHDDNHELFDAVPRLQLKDIAPSLQYILWDQARGHIVSIAEHEADKRAATQSH